MGFGIRGLGFGIAAGLWPTPEPSQASAIIHEGTFPTVRVPTLQRNVLRISDWSWPFRNRWAVRGHRVRLRCTTGCAYLLGEGGKARRQESDNDHHSSRARREPPRNTS